MASLVQLKLIGKPVLWVGSAEVEVKPRAVFELLAVIMLSGTGELSRNALASRLWGHLDKANSRIQLRIGLHKLREELRKLEILELFDLNEKTVRCIENVSIDYVTLLKTQPILTFEQVKDLIHPLADGWNPEHWLAERDAFGEFLAKRLEAARHGAKNRDELIAVLQRATNCYPTTLSLYLQLAKLLRIDGREAEMVEMVIKFEDSWVDRFGSADIPNLMELAKGQEVAEVREAPAVELPSPPEPVAIQAMAVAASKPFAPKPMIAAIPLVVIALAWLIGTRFFPASASVAGQSLNGITLSVVSTSKVQVQGSEYKIIQLKVHGGTLSNCSACSTGDINLEVQSGDQPRVVQLHSSGQVTSIIGRKGEQPLCGFSSFHADSDNFISIKTGVINRTIAGTHKLPHVHFEKVLPDGRLLFSRRALTPQEDVSAEYLADGKQDIPLVAKTAEKGVVISTLVLPDLIFLKYTSGEAEGWKFHVAKFVISTGTLVPLDCAPVVGRLSDGTLLTRPERVTPDGPGYQITPTGTTVLVDSNGSQRTLTVRGHRAFEASYGLGNLIVLLTPHDGDTETLIFADQAGKLIELPIPKTVSAVDLDEISGTVLVSHTNPSMTPDYFLLQTVAR